MSLHLVKLIIDISYNMIDFTETQLVICSPDFNFFLLDDNACIKAKDLKIGNCLSIYYDAENKRDVYRKVKSKINHEEIPDLCNRIFFSNGINLK
jgi:hypothetical protein